MEKEGLFNNDLNSSTLFINPNWDNQDQSDPFESALSSMVSSPTAAAAAHHSISNSNPSPNHLLRELIGRLGTICNSADITTNANGNNTNNNTSCYTTPLSSPPKLNLSSFMDMEMDMGIGIGIRGNSDNPNPNPNHFPFSPDPAFAQRAARFSCFANNHRHQNISGSNNSSTTTNPVITVQESRGVDSDKNFTRRLSTPDNVEFADSRENSSVSEQIPPPPPPTDANSRKRKSILPKGKETTKDTSATAAASENSESGGKRSKSEDGKEKDKISKGSNSKENAAAEAPKDYIHVRARRGQATDAHSLAERVRREKISERMKVLQDLVPGCNKVTGKAVMLDEIINYVQSLQRQVEFLSMKLAAVNPRMDSADMDAAAAASKDAFECRGSLTHNMYQQQPWESHHLINSQLNLLHNNNAMMLNPNPDQAQAPPPNNVNGRNQSLHLIHHFPVDNFSEPTAAATSQVWEDDLHSFVQMGFGQNQTHAAPTNNNAHGGIRMKVEL